MMMMMMTHDGNMIQITSEHSVVFLCQNSEKIRKYALAYAYTPLHCDRDVAIRKDLVSSSWPDFCISLPVSCKKCGAGHFAAPGHKKNIKVTDIIESPTDLIGTVLDILKNLNGKTF
jgi:hypothetical protein